MRKKQMKEKAKHRTNKLSCPPPRRRGGRHMKNNELEKERKNNQNSTTCKQSKTKNQGKMTKGKKQDWNGSKQGPNSSLGTRMAGCCRIRCEFVNDGRGFTTNS